jgi:hypothetical protein
MQTIWAGLPGQLLLNEIERRNLTLRRSQLILIPVPKSRLYPLSSFTC